ncbi:MAG: SulP family inorganic anion transporter [Anaerolineales bacterium]|nr:SulP family inorganic anion transporter [Anaerolineales bacterium]
MPRRSLARLYRDEFTGYSPAKFRNDLTAGLNVALVALPLALAFGAASGASAAAGLVTSIVGGIVIGLFAGAPYQMTGAKAVISVVLIVLVNQYGLEGMWVALFMAGLLTLAIGLLRLGRFIAFIPSTVISGFTAGISAIIIIRQFDPLLGIHTPTTITAAQKLIAYFTTPNLTPNLHSLLLGLLVMGIMFLYPAKWNERVPGSLMALIIATASNFALGWSVNTIESIPQTLFLQPNFSIPAIPWENISDFVAPALTLTALGSVETLLCGAAGSEMTGKRLQVNQHLIAQGIGNMLLPFFGAIPTTSGILRTKVAIHSGGQTRLTGIIHSLILLAVMFTFADYLAMIPLSALAGVLMVTAIRSVDLSSVKFTFGNFFKTDMIAFLVAFIATVVLSLTNAILFGTFLMGAVFLNKSASIDISIQEVDVERLKQRGIETEGKCKHVRVAFLTGPLFFAATSQFSESFADLGDTHALILSMRGVPLIDSAGIEAIHKLHTRLQKNGGTLMFAGIHDNAKQMMERGGLVKIVGEENFFWSSDQAIVEAERRGCKFC